VNFPEDSTILIDNPRQVNTAYWEYALPLAPDTKSWDNRRLSSPYMLAVYAYKGQTAAVYVIDDIDVTGTIYDLTYIQPVR
jgi:hypothetical protein